MTRWLVTRQEPSDIISPTDAYLAIGWRPARPFDNYTATILHWSIQPFDDYPRHLACSHNGLGTCNWALVSNDWASQQGRSNKDMDTGCRNSLRTKNRKLLVVIVIIMIHNHLLHHPSAWKRHQGGAQDQVVRKVAVYLHYRSPTSAALILRLVLKPWSATHQTSNFRKCWGLKGRATKRRKRN